jgi:hypothetical protein
MDKSHGCTQGARSLHLTADRKIGSEDILSFLGTSQPKLWEHRALGVYELRFYDSDPSVEGGADLFCLAGRELIIRTSHIFEEIELPFDLSHTTLYVH